MDRTPYKASKLPGSPIILNGSVRYGVSRHVAATDAAGHSADIAIVVIERENGAFETLAVPEEKIRFAGESIIEAEVRARVGL
jgi:hypothetical protein